MNQVQKEILNSLSQEKWILLKDLIQILNNDYQRVYKESKLRDIIKQCRLLYKEDRLTLLIIKSNKGYKLSNDLVEIKQFAEEMIQSGESMINEGRELYQAALSKKSTRNKEVESSTIPKMIIVIQ